MRHPKDHAQLPADGWSDKHTSSLVEAILQRVAIDKRDSRRKSGVWSNPATAGTGGRLGKRNYPRRTALQLSGKMESAGIGGDAPWRHRLRFGLSAVRSCDR